MNPSGTDPGPATGLLAEARSGSGSGAYVLDACVHSSQTSDLYRVHVADGHPDPGFPLVMKLAHARAGQDHAGFVRCEVEHQVLPLLGGPHVPRFVASIDLARAPRLVMSWEEGRPLQDWLDAPQGPGTDEVLRLGVALARAVHCLHRQHVVHHDLQPAHVQVRPDGSVVLFGFGQACHAQLPDLLATALSSHRAVARSWQRTAADWLAPEQLLGVRGDVRSDIFAIGVMLYQLLGGRLPFGTAQGDFGVRRRLWQTPPALQSYNPAVTPWLQAVVQRCLAPDAAQRYPSAAHLLFDLLHPQPLAPVATGLAGWLREMQTRGRGGLRALGLLDEAVPAKLVDGWPAPIVMLVVTPCMLGEPPSERLRLTLQRTLGAHPGARLLCAMVMAPGSHAMPGQPGGGDDDAVPLPAIQGDSSGTSADDAETSGVDGTPRRGLARLRQWARALGQPGRGVACRVLVDANAVQALLACAGEHFVNDIVLPLPMTGFAATQAQATAMETGMRAEMGAQLALSAPCTVQLVRP